MKNNKNNKSNKDIIDTTEYVFPKVTSIPVNEQETVIQFGRDDKYATICTSDRTMQTKLDNLCISSPENYICTKSDRIFKTYKMTDKKLLSFRQKKRELSEEAKEAASKRFKEMWADRTQNENEEEVL